MNKEDFEKFNLETSHSLTLNLRQRCDLELLINGGFHPLNSFMSQKDY